MMTAVLQSIGRLFFIIWMAVNATLCASARSDDTSRIVSIGGDVTEILFALGFGESVVATDSSSPYPPEALKLPKVGYGGAISAEGVLSEKPNLIFLGEGSGPTIAIEQLNASGVTVVQVTSEYSIPAILEKIDVIADALDAEAEGARLKRHVEDDWEKARIAIDRLPPRSSYLFLAPLEDPVTRAAGAGTRPQSIIELLDGRNVFASQSGYTSFNQEGAVAVNPDIILVMTPYEGASQTEEELMAHPTVRLTPAVRDGMLIQVDSAGLLQFGPRTPATLEALSQEIETRGR